MTRRTDAQEASRADVENALSQVAVAQVLLDTQVTLRIQQALRRDCHLTDLLGPALDQLVVIDAALHTAKTQLGKIWTEEHA